MKFSPKNAFSMFSRKRDPEGFRRLMASGYLAGTLAIFGAAATFGVGMNSVENEAVATTEYKNHVASAHKRAGVFALHKDWREDFVANNPIAEIQLASQDTNDPWLIQTPEALIPLEIAFAKPQKIRGDDLNLTGLSPEQRKAALNELAARQQDPNISGDLADVQVMLGLANRAERKAAAESGSGYAAAAGTIALFGAATAGGLVGEANRLKLSRRPEYGKPGKA